MEQKSIGDCIFRVEFRLGSSHFNSIGSVIVYRKAHSREVNEWNKSLHAF